MASLPSELILEIVLNCDLLVWLRVTQTCKLWQRRLSHESVLRSVWSKSNEKCLYRLLSANRIWSPLNLRHLEINLQYRPEFWAQSLHLYVWIVPYLLSLPQNKEVTPILEGILDLALPPTNIGYSNYLPLVREAIMQGKEEHLKLIISRMTDDNLFDSLLLWAPEKHHAKLLSVIIERLGPPPRSYLERISIPEAVEVLGKYGIKIPQPKKAKHSWFYACLFMLSLSLYIVF